MCVSVYLMVNSSSWIHLLGPITQWWKGDFWSWLFGLSVTTVKVSQLSSLAVIQVSPFALFFFFFTFNSFSFKSLNVSSWMFVHLFIYPPLRDSKESAVLRHFLQTHSVLMGSSPSYSWSHFFLSVCIVFVCNVLYLQIRKKHSHCYFRPETHQYTVNMSKLYCNLAKQWLTLVSSHSNHSEVYTWRAQVELRLNYKYLMAQLTLVLGSKLYLVM